MQTQKQRTRTPAKADLVRTTDGLWPLSNKITIYGWSTLSRYHAEADAGPGISNLVHGVGLFHGLGSSAIGVANYS